MYGISGNIGIVRLFPRDAIARNGRSGGFAGVAGIAKIAGVAAGDHLLRIDGLIGISAAGRSGGIAGVV